MTKDNTDYFQANWYDVWGKQSKDFFETANQYLQNIFSQPSAPNPADHLDQIKAWLDQLKKQWESTVENIEQDSYQLYFTMMNKMFSEASELMIKKWIRRAESQTPVKNMVELYELWLECCHEVYQKSMQTKTHQEMYGDMINSAIKFWKETMPK